MNRNAYLFLAALSLAALIGCSSDNSKTAQKPAIPLDKIQGKAQVLVESGGASDAAMNAGGSSIYLWQGERRYRLFLKTAADIIFGSEYVAEGVYAQKAIDDIGDPDNGKNGYPLHPSVERVVARAWPKLSFDDMDATVTLVSNRVKRYPARALFLVVRIRPATAEETAAAKPKEQGAADDKDIHEVSVAAEKQKSFLIEGAAILPAPLWEPAGGTIQCKVIIDQTGKVAELETGAQLCESVQWSHFRYQPPVERGKPVRVETEIEVKFEARK